MADQYPSLLDTSQIQAGKRTPEEEAEYQRLKAHITGQTALHLGAAEEKLPSTPEIAESPNLNTILQKMFPPTPIPRDKPDVPLLHNLALPFTDPKGVSQRLLQLPAEIPAAIASDVGGMASAVFRPGSPEEGAALNKQFPLRNSFDLPNIWRQQWELTKQRATEMAEHVPIVGGAVKNLEENYQKELEDSPTPSAGQKANAATAAVTKTLWNFGTEDIGPLLTQDLSGEDAVNKVANLAAKAGLVRGIWRAASNSLDLPTVSQMTEGTPKEQPTYTSGEMAAAKVARDIQKQKLNQAVGQMSRSDLETMAKREGVKGPAEDISSGIRPVPLDNGGQAQAADLAPRVANADKIYTSNVVRAQQTAQIISGGRIPIANDSSISAGLAAPDLGEWTGKPTDDIQPKINALPPNEAPPGGESLNDLRNRILPTFQKLVDESEANPTQRILAVTHSRNLDLMQAWIDNGTPKDFNVTPEQLAEQTSSGPASLLKVFRTPEGFLQMGEVNDTSEPGLHFVRHGETTDDGTVDNGGPDSTVSNANRPIIPQQVWQEQMDQLPDSVKSRVQTANTLDVPFVRQLNRAVVSDDVLRQAFIDRLRTGHPATQAVLDIYGNEPVADQYMQDALGRAGDSPSDVRVAGLLGYANAMTKGGQNLGDLGNMVKEFTAETFPQTESGTLEARLQAQDTMRQLAQIRNLLKDGSPTKINTMANWFQKIERTRLGGMVDPLRTGMGIAESQLGLAGQDLLDNMSTDLVNAFKGQTSALVQGSKVPTAPYFNETFSQLQALAGRFGYDKLLDKLQDWGMPGVDSMPRRAMADKILDQVPRLRQQIMSGLLFESDTSLLGQTLKNSLQAAKESNDLGQFGRKMGTVVGQLTKPPVGSIPYGEGPFGKTLEATHNVINMGVDALNSFNRWQETEFRKLAFEGRLRANLKQIPDAPDYGKPLVDYLRQGHIDADTGNVIPINPAIREALIDAEHHALRQTYAFTPEGGLLGGTLKILRPLTPIAIPFPRSMVNNIMWQVHHNPAWIADAFTPEFRDAFYGLAKDDPTLPMKQTASGEYGPEFGKDEMAGNRTPVDDIRDQASRDASRKIGRALGGLALMNASMHLAQNGELKDRDTAKVWRMGAKPWLLTNGETDKDGNKMYVDFSSEQPFSNFNDIAYMMNAKLTNAEDHAKFSEVLEHMLNSNLEQNEVFNIGSVIRNLDSKDPNVVQNAILQSLGQYLGSFGTTYHGLREEYAAGQAAWAKLQGYDKQGLIKPSQSGEGWTAPILSQFSPDSLKPQVDIFRNQNPAVEEHPLQRLARLDKRPMTPFEELMTRSDIDPFEITKHYKDPMATYLVRAATAQMLARPDFTIGIGGQGEMNLQDFARAALKNRQYGVTQLELKKILPVIHRAAEAMAIAQDANDHNHIPVHFQDESTVVPNAHTLSQGIPGAQEMWKQLLLQKAKQAPQ